MKRGVKQISIPISAQDGAGVQLKRLFPIKELDNIDPFLLLDHFGSDNADDYIAGFPMHPHRGIETVTYILEGCVNHNDSAGNSGTIEAGDVQWMSAGRGIMHEEMPEVTNGKLDGFQLWVNLPAHEKMKQPDYQGYKSADITKFTHDNHTIRLISGELLGRKGVVSNISTVPIYADIRMSAGTILLDLPETHNAFIYSFGGQVSVINDQGSSSVLNPPMLAILTSGKQLELYSPSNARILLIAGKPTNEPIVRAGPFVMNTREEIEQTFRELREGCFPPA